MQVDPAIRLPVDSEAAVTLSSLLGGSHIELVPGTDSELIGSDGLIVNAKDALRLDLLLERILTSGAAAELGKSGGIMPGTLDSDL